MKRKLVLTTVSTLMAMVLVVSIGCGRRDRHAGEAAKVAMRRTETGPEAVVVPAKTVSLGLVEPGRDRFGGLYAISAGLKIDAFSRDLWFRAVADHHGADLRGPGRGTASVRLVGRLPGTVSAADFFLPEAGTIRNGEIEIPVKFVRNIRVGAKFPLRVAYVGGCLRGLPPGHYRVRITFKDYTYLYDEKDKITPAPPNRPPSFQPLTCEFEVPKAGVAGDARGGKVKSANGYKR